MFIFDSIFNDVTIINLGTTVVMLYLKNRKRKHKKKPDIPGYTPPKLPKRWVPRRPRGKKKAPYPWLPLWPFWFLPTPYIPEESWWDRILKSMSHWASHFHKDKGG